MDEPVGLVFCLAEAAVSLDLSVLWVVFFILILSVILDRLIFRPVLRVIKQREDAVSSARKLAEQATAEARRASEEFDRKEVGLLLLPDMDIAAARLGHVEPCAHEPVSFCWTMPVAKEVTELMSKRIAPPLR